MKKLGIMLVVLAITLLSACTKVPAGNVGVEFSLYGSDKGVQVQELQPGRYPINPWTTEISLFPTFTQTYTWTLAPDENSKTDESISFGTDQGMTVNADVGITYHIQPDKVTILFQKYRKGVDEITQVYLRNMVRDALVKEASQMPIESVYGTGKSKLIAAVQADVQGEVGDIGIEVEKVYWIGDLRLPQAVRDSINSKIQATQNAQRAENEVATAKAEAQKVEATAEGNAQATLINAKADAQALQLRGEALRANPETIQLEWIKKWNGTVPTYQMGNATPLIQIPAISK